ncbi:hypothetical protein NC797_07095 [Aquibacillus sp. 3ASR75-11]|uniref:TrbC/VIRB2 family protein n=1 Tax=Terrihalobacillus insolitus TaxID=2950438 RepID=A0A9X3WSY5_9BACI|nr:hypothetical protein [Terrihalobacillus insolitus]MDC3424273.1 hypothetical protein [Terrihalobacillus insolitus]
MIANKTKKLFTLLSLMAVLTFSLVVVSPESAFAGAWNKAGITPDGSIENSGIYDDLDKLVYFVMALGGFWILACLIFAGIKLAASQGNPQGRTQGFIGLGMAFIGGWVIMKAYDIAGWIAGFGA